MSQVEDIVSAPSLFPATEVQTRFWYLDQLSGSTASNTVAVQLELRGPINDTAIRQAFDSIIGRHEVLRTSFIEIDGVLHQHVAERGDFSLGVIDVRGIAPNERARRIEKIAETSAREPFDLSRPALMRATLVLFGTDRAMLLLAVHHAVFDGHSIRVFGDELGRLLEAHASGVNADLAPLDLQYGDYALWQQAMTQTGARDEAAAYWAQQLNGMSYFELPGRRSAPPYGPRRSERLLVDLDDDFAAGLEASAKAQDVSPFTLGAAAMAAALFRATGAPDISFSTPIAGRTDAALDPLIGAFVNPAVLRFKFDDRPTMASLVGQARDVVSGAVAHGDYPFDALVRDLHDRGVERRTPLVSVNFGLQTVFLEERTYGALELRSMPSVMPEVAHDLNVLVIGRSAGWKFIIDYDGDVFTASEIDVIANDLRAAFDQIAEGGNGVLEPRFLAAPSDTPRAAPSAATEVRVTDTAISQRAAELWAEVLGRPMGAISGDFFDLGGHSLLSLRMLSRTEAEFGVRPSLADFLAATEFTAFCGMLERLITGEQGGAVSPWGRLDLGGDAGSPHLFVSINQPFLYHAMGESLSATGQCMNLHLTDPAHLKSGAEADLNGLVEKAATLIAGEARGRGITLIGHCVDGSLALRIAAALPSAEVDRTSVALLDTWRPGHWSTIHPWRRKLYRYREWLGRWGKHARRLVRGQMSPAAFIAQNARGRRLMARFGWALAESDLERREIEINHRLVATLNDLPVVAFAGRVMLFSTESQPIRARKEMFGWRGDLAADTPIFDVPGWHETALLSDGVSAMRDVLASQAQRLR